ncbi:ABC transporter permease [Streptomyces sp. bgisy159]|uniref:ABC transporter permease n=1 Tax=Streptomyces sp. bgisy159 TaxID=3413795 RepID=UPI003F4A3C38
MPTSSTASPTGAAQPAQPAEAAPPPVGRRLLAATLLAPALALLALWAFAWPAARTAPHDLPLGLAGPAAATAPLEQRLREGHEGAFRIHRYADEAAAREAVEDRTVYGAVVAAPDGPKLLTASAASPVVAQLLRRAVGEQAAASGTPLRTEDVVAAPAADPRGATLTASVLPLVMAGLAAGSAVTLLGLRGGRAAVALTGAAGLVGLAAATLADSWLGVLDGNWWAEAGAFGLATLAVAGAVAGAAALAGRAGIALVGALMMLIGNPFSGAATAPHLLPEPVGTLGQWLPPGASASLLRSVGYFGGAAATGPLITLAWWAALGLAAVLLGTRLTSRAGSPAPAVERELAPAS